MMVNLQNIYLQEGGENKSTAGQTQHNNYGGPPHSQGGNNNHFSGKMLT